MKKCSFCGLEKEETEFFKKRENSLEGFCKIWLCRKCHAFIHRKQM